MLQAAWIPPRYKTKNKSSAAMNLVIDAASDSDLSSAGAISLTAQQYQNLVSLLTTQLANAAKPVATTSEPTLGGGISCTIPNNLLHSLPTFFWIVDLGTTKHICTSFDKFISYPYVTIPLSLS